MVTTASYLDSKMYYGISYFNLDFLKVMETKMEKKAIRYSEGIKNSIIEVFD